MNPERIWMSEKKRPQEFARREDFLEFCRLANVGSLHEIRVKESGLGLGVENLEIIDVHPLTGTVHSKDGHLRWAWACLRLRYWARRCSKAAEQRLRRKMGCDDE